MASNTPGVTFHDLSAGGQAGGLIREKDWSGTSLGPREGWPRSLQNQLAMILQLPTAAIIFWGEELVSSTTTATRSSWGRGIPDFWAPRSANAGPRPTRPFIRG